MQKGGPPKPHETATASDGSLDEVARELGGVDADGPKMKGASASGGPIAGGPIKVDPGVTKGKPTTAPTAPVGEPPVKANEPFVAPATGNGPKDVDAIIAKNRWRFRACYNKELQLHPDAMGTLKVKVDVAEDGTVTGAHVMSSDVSPTLEACVLGAFRAMRFAEEEHACLFVVPVRLTTGK
ncbi:MAG: AgmX/PglI C-terminal domain-containing protein [Deltaproteobacteria bacterium]|nr:AgmX/PglI C-terminal domain-containing protein [Deltaproteobacteria bacterium]